MAKLAAQPLYQQVKKEVIAAIQDGEWLADETLPSENDLARRFGVSQGTVRKALDVLVSEGVLYRRQGVGTFVAGVRDELLAARLVPLAAQHGVPVQIELVSSVRIHAAEGFAELLGLRRGAALWQVRRLVRAEGEVVGLEEILLPESNFPNLEMRRIRELKGHLRELLWRDYGVRLVDDAVHYRAIAATAADARSLQVEVNEPLLQITRLSRDYENKPLVWSVVVLRTDKISFEP